MKGLHFVLVAAAVGLLPIAGCKAAPSQRPMEMGPVDTGPNSMEAVRRQLEGTWDLISLDLYTPAGERVPAEATGRLQYDEFGNLSMRGTLSGGAHVEESVLNMSGRVIIDPGTRTFRFGDVSAPTADEKRLDPKLAAANVRYYEIEGDVLKTTVKGADGRTTATATWKKVQ